MDFLSLLTAFSLGLLGSAHCLGMCGGIIGALTLGTDTQKTTFRWGLIACYNLGRILSYVLLAVLFYLLLGGVHHYFEFGFMRVVAGLLLIAMGLYLANWWQGLVYLEKLGGYFWRFIQPLSQSLLPVRSFSQALLLGSIWGWLPCGLIYSALVYSASADTLAITALTMLSFALGTLPAVLLTGLFAERLMSFIKLKQVRWLMALLIMAFGLWTILQALGHHHHPSPKKEGEKSHHHHHHH